MDKNGKGKQNIKACFVFERRQITEMTEIVDSDSDIISVMPITLDSDDEQSDELSDFIIESVDSFNNWISNSFNNLFTRCFPCQRTAGDDFRDIAHSLISTEQEMDQETIPLIESINENKTEQKESSNSNKINEISIRITNDHMIDIISVKFGGSHFPVAFKTNDNDPDIQKVIDTWFMISDNNIYVKPELFYKLNIYYFEYKNKVRSVSWYKNRGGWIKFNNLEPCAFKTVKANMADR